jgi:hypothetical protein
MMMKTTTLKGGDFKMRKLMARMCFSAGEKAELGIAALREKGFTILTRVFEDHPDYVFVQAERYVSDTGGDYELASKMLHEVCDMVEEGDPASLAAADIDALFAKLNS